MKKQDHVIVGIHVTNRVKHATEVQAVFTQFGGTIKTRLGLHDTAHKDTDKGLILIEIVAPAGKVTAFCSALARIKGVDVKKMVFKHG
jgi:hypothetical protein